MTSSTALPQLLALALTPVCAVTDLRSARIPNLLTLPPLALAPLVHLSLGGPGALGVSLAGAVACALVPLFAFARGSLGGGDLKLYTALGAALGVDQGLLVQLGSLLLASLFAAGCFVRDRSPTRTRARSLRMGPAIAAATWLVLLAPALRSWLGA